MPGSSLRPRSYLSASFSFKKPASKLTASLSFAESSCSSSVLFLPFDKIASLTFHNSWGYAFSFATILVYLQSHDPWQQNSLSALSAIGTTQLGLLYVLPCVWLSCRKRASLADPCACSTFAVVVLRRYGEYVRLVQWTSLVVSCCSMFLSSWATQVSLHPALSTITWSYADVPYPASFGSS